MSDVQGRLLHVRLTGCMAGSAGMLGMPRMAVPIGCGQTLWQQQASGPALTNSDCRG
jgi:hypothetical protein